MKDFKDYEDEIYKCSRCGLCQNVCPIYDITGNETNVSRGFFTLLMGVLKGHLSFNKKVRRNLDACLHCNACKDYCPSGIDPVKIMAAANFATFQFANPLKKLALRITYSRTFLKIASIIKFYRFFPLLNFCKVGQILHKFLIPTTKYVRLKPQEKKNLKVAIFPGCINNYFNSSTLNAMRMVLESSGIEYTIPKEFECCTIASYHTGDIKNFKKFAHKNLQTVPSDIDYLIFDCASCLKAFKVYGEIFHDEPTQSIMQKSIHINEFLAKESINLPQCEKQKASYHKPCHLECYDETLNIINKLSITLAPIKSKCCGMAGLFSIDNFKISNMLASEKAIEMAIEKLALTDCPLCKIGIIKGAVIEGKELEVKHPIEILAQNLER